MESPSMSPTEEPEVVESEEPEPEPTEDVFEESLYEENNFSTYASTDSYFSFNSVSDVIPLLQSYARSVPSDHYYFAQIYQPPFSSNWTQFLDSLIVTSEFRIIAVFCELSEEPNIRRQVGDFIFKKESVVRLILTTEGINSFPGIHSREFFSSAFPSGFTVSYSTATSSFVWLKSLNPLIDDLSPTINVEGGDVNVPPITVETKDYTVYFEALLFAVACFWILYFLNRTRTSLRIG